MMSILRKFRELMALLLPATPAEGKRRLAVFLLFAFSMVAWGTAAAQASLPVIVADFNHDGIPDTLVLSATAPTATLAFGAVPYGTFSANAKLVTFPGGCTSLPQGSVVVGDFNHDGFPDIAFFCASVAGVMLGNGDGTFATAVSLTGYVGGTPVLGDFNKDGKLDIVVLKPFGGGYGPTVTLEFFAGNGDGTFASSVVTTLAAIDYTGPVAADVNADGYPDIVLLYLSDGGPPTLQVFGNNKDGTFGIAANGYASPNVYVNLGYDEASSILTGNFFGTGATDFVVPTDASLVVIQNTSTATTYSLGTPATIPYTGLLNALAGNFTGSGFTDIVASNGTSIAVLANSADGNANFTASYSTLTLTTTNALFSVADANGDGYSDIYTAFQPQTGPLQLGVNITSGTATATAQPVPLNAGSQAISATWPGNVNFTGSNATGHQQVNGAPVAPTLTWVLPATIPFGTPLGETELDAVATGTGGAVVPGTYLYTPTTGTLLGLGAHALSVVFTPTDTADYTVASATQTVTVVAAAPTTTLALTSGGTAVTTIASGSVLTLTASVGAPGIPVTTGQVNFCNAAATTCTDINLLGTAQLTSAGTATLRFVPGIGAHSYKAVFLGTKNDVGSASAAATLTVTGTYPTTTTIAQSGAAGNYTLTATTTSTNGANVAPTGKVSFLDSSNGSAVLGTGSLGVGTEVLNFVAHLSPLVGENPQTRGAIGDFNGDGILDIATANTAPDETQTMYANTVSISLGNGDGTFTSQGLGPATGVGPESIVSADFNGDGKLDLATANTTDSTVTVLLGNGNGTFAAASQTPAVGASPNGIVTGDFNGDGKADLAVAVGNGVTVLLGNGDGTFTALATIVSGFAGSQIATADFNGDGKADLVVRGYSSTPELLVLLGNGDGTFTTAQTIAVAESQGGIAVGDFNGDGIPDFAATGSSSENAVTIYVGKGDGTFTAKLAASATYGDPLDIQAADFNGDGKLDLAVINFTESVNREVVLLGNGDGTFTLPGISTGIYAYDAVAIGDFNGDGVPDIEATGVGSGLEIALTNRMQTAVATATAVTPIGTGPHQVVASYPGDTNYGASVSQPTGLTGIQLVPTLTWVPAVLSVVYGTPLGAQQLNAVATTPAGAALAGVLTYTPAAGAVLDAGAQTLQVVFTPTDAVDYLPASGSVTITVTPAKPVITWATPASIAYGVPLSATQLDATVAGVTGAALPGTLTYTPAAGAVLNPGTQTLTVSFAPTNTLDYTTATGSVQLTVAGVTVASAMPATATLGDPATTVTLSGAGFVATSVVQVNGTAIPTTFVNAATLMAVIPASYFATVGTLQITVSDPTVSLTSPAFTFNVVAPAASASITAPSTTDPGSQPVITFTIDQPYPIPLDVALTLSFAASTTPAIDDPNVQFSAGGRTLSFVVLANTTTVPTIQLQSGTVAGTITVPVTLTAAGVNVTPTTLVPVVITVSPAAPTITGMTVSRSGNQLTAVIHGFSNTRQMNTATFHFTASSTATAPLSTTDLTVPADTIFTTWYSATPSDQYGSSFTYTQVFTVSDMATDIGTVKATLTNSVGASNSMSAQ
jgi:hypothetical protein